MSWVAFVWLRDGLSKAEINKLYRKFEGRDFENCEVSGPRKVQTVKQYWRLMRNALSHGHVNVKEGNFEFYDKDDKNDKEDRDTFLIMSWETLGRISNDIIVRAGEVLYPRENIE